MNNAQQIFLTLLEKSEERVAKTNEMVNKFADAATTISATSVHINEMVNTINRVCHSDVDKLMEDLRNLIANCEKKDEDIRLLQRVILQKDEAIAEMQRRIDKLTGIIAAFAGSKDVITIHNK